jgi:transposase-like protein
MRATKKTLPTSHPSIAAASRESGIAPATLRKWRDKEKIDVLNPAAVKKRAAVKQQRADRPAASKSITADTGESYSEARRRREIANANRAELITQREAGRLVGLDTVKQSFMQIGAEVKARLMSARGDLVNELVGKDEAGIYKILDTRFRDLLQALYDSAPYENSPHYKHDT